jgi:hypothetical protein
MPSKPIVVVASINLDFVCKAERIPVAGETITGSSFQTFHGGEGANQAVAAARLAHPVVMIAKVGDDSFGRQLRGALKSAGVDTRAVTTARRTASGVALVSTDRQGQNSIVVIPGANGQLCPDDVQRALQLLRSAAMILTQLEIPIDTIECLARVACRYQVPSDVGSGAGTGTLPRTIVQAGLLDSQRNGNLHPHRPRPTGACQRPRVGGRSSKARRHARGAVEGDEPVTQFGLMCTRREIELIAASSPQATGRMERMHGTHEDRLVEKLRRNKIATHAQASAYREAEYLPDHNPRFGRAAADARIITAGRRRRGSWTRSSGWRVYHPWSE